jgi:hypothetical protein
MEKLLWTFVRADIKFLFQGYVKSDAYATRYFVQCPPLLHYNL